MKGIYLFLLLSSVAVSVQCREKADTLYTELKSDVVVLSSTKETNSLKSLPASVSVFSPKNLSELQIHSLKDLSSFAPNYYVADYGSKMTAPLYIRGIGARSGSQTVSYYVDNIPYFNTTSFDTELFDIQRIEILRGTQGTLYGRNSMGGIINVYTYSPLSYQGTNIEVGGGAYGQFDIKASHYRKLNNNLGIGVSAYYSRNDGYFTNHYTGKKIDDMQSAGARAKLEWRINNRLTATYSFNFDFVNQGAFPYADLRTNEINYNSPSYYMRRLITNGLSLRYLQDKYEINSTTGYQFLNDDMNMDQDYTPASLFMINQHQLENSVSEEVTIKSRSRSNYQWSNGFYGFYDHLSTVPPVYMMQDGIKQLIEDPANKVLPPGMKLDILDDQLDLGGKYKSPTYGLALFHQSTYNHLFVKGLSATVGVRLDYENTALNYNANTTMHYTFMPFVPKPATSNVLLAGNVDHSYLEFLPKVLLKYEFNSNSFLYISTSKGYKSGGHNIQIFADLLQEALEKNLRPKQGGSAPEESISDRITYKPEHSWNYEIGGHTSYFDNRLAADLSLFYMDVSNVQITQFIKSGGGRKVSNAGKAISKGFELSLKGRPCKGFYVYGNYGYSDARFEDYKVVNKKTVIDYKGKHIPFAPTTTYSIGGNVTCDTSKKMSWLDQFVMDVNFGGTGRIYWTEDNSISQAFYGTLNASFAFTKKRYTVEFWGKNLLNRDYNTFVFESMGQHFGQKGKPLRCGVTFKIKL